MKSVTAQKNQRCVAMVCSVVLVLKLANSLCAAHAELPFRLSHSNTEVPFCYLPAGQRSWPIASSPLPKGHRLLLTVRQNGKVMTQGETVAWSGLTLSVAADGTFTVVSKRESDDISLQLEVRHESPGRKTITQKLSIRRAPPVRPLTYLADFGDDIIRIFFDGKSDYKTIQKESFDQYFRRLQAHGIARLIVWQSPFPYIVDPKNYSAEDWQRYQQQAVAILENQELSAGIHSKGSYAAWGWLRQLMALRLMPDLGEMLSTSACEHGIRLTASFRPFEAALSKYYVVPAFDEQGNYLWSFQPLCSPTVNYHPDKTGFVHNREMLRRMGRKENAQLATIDLPGVKNAAALVERSRRGQVDITLHASSFPPLAAESFMLVRQSNGKFVLRRWRDIREKAVLKLPEMTGIRLESYPGGLRIHDVDVPKGGHYLLLTQPADSPVVFTVSSERPVLMSAQAGNRLGGENVYFALAEVGDQPEPTRVSGIQPNGHYHAEFQATEASIAHFIQEPERVSLKGKQLVINLGADYSIEMMDFRQSAAREFAVKQLRTLLSYPAFDGIFINTRSHTQLAGYLGDDGKSIRPLRAIRSEGASCHLLSYDRAYIPRDAAGDSMMRKLAADPATIERITTVQQGEWRAVTSQSEEPHAWRYTRNWHVAHGVRELLLGIRRAFPKTRIRAVIPPSAASVERILRNLDRLKGNNGLPFGRKFYNRLWPTNNHMPTFGEGMAMVNLTDTEVEPVFFGTSHSLQEATTFQMYVRECIADLADNRGSVFHGPRSYFYEGQYTLRTTDKSVGRHEREKVICHLLSQKKDIGDVILYEAADWTYFLTLSDSDLCGHYFLDRCEELPLGPIRKRTRAADGL